MKSEEIDVGEYTEYEGADLETLINLHREIFATHPLHGSLIYFDDCFKPYLNKLLRTSEVDRFFIAKKGTNIIGFSHFKILNCNNLFLNNISISKDHQGGGSGKKLLKESLKILEDQFGKIYLDVFLSNLRALNWYGRLGFTVESYNVWKVFNKLSVAETSSRVLITRCVDENGFNSLFFEGRKGGTIINDKIFVVNDPDILLNINLPEFTMMITNKDLLPKIDYRVLDVSVRMSIDYKKLTAKIYK